LMALIPGKCLLIYTNNFVVGQGHNLGGLPLTRQPRQKNPRQASYYQPREKKWYFNIYPLMNCTGYIILSN